MDLYVLAPRGFAFFHTGIIVDCDCFAHADAVLPDIFECFPNSGFNVLDIHRPALCLAIVADGGLAGNWAFST